MRFRCVDGLSFFHCCTKPELLVNSVKNPTLSFCIVMHSCHFHLIHNMKRMFRAFLFSGDMSNKSLALCLGQALHHCAKAGGPYSWQCMPLFSPLRNLSSVACVLVHLCHFVPALMQSDWQQQPVCQVLSYNPALQVSLIYRKRQALGKRNDTIHDPLSWKPE